jgi:hypothetical protein
MIQGKGIDGLINFGSPGCRKYHAGVCRIRGPTAHSSCLLPYTAKLVQSLQLMQTYAKSQV